MASGQGSRTGTRKKSASSSAKKTSRGKAPAKESLDIAIQNEILLIAVFAAAVFLFLCNFGIAGVAGQAISGVMFGIFGLTAYVAPLLLFLAAAFGISNHGSYAAVRKITAGVMLFLLTGIVCELIAGNISAADSYHMKELFDRCRETHNGGGLLAGTLAYLCYHYLSMAGTVLVILVLGIICIVILTERSFVGSVRSGGKKVMERTREDALTRRERQQEKKVRLEEERAAKEEERRLREEEKENERILRMDKKVSGVMMNTALEREEEAKSRVRDDIHEIIINDLDGLEVNKEQIRHENPLQELDKIHITGAFQMEMDDGEEKEKPIGDDSYTAPEPVSTGRVRPPAKLPPAGRSQEAAPQMTDISADIVQPQKNIPKKYAFPPISKLKKGERKGGGDTARQLKETALHLQQTLHTFGVNVTITDISQGPSVTRYELQPEQGVKVSKIVNLADDIKLNLAATDIRIEAPIPGKAAVGIEVPNKENTAVALRDLLESKEFKEFPSNLAFAVGKDIGGKTVVADIAKMPHMLIAGATGSGKSVCINTIIMSILYKAHPEDVKLIMVDPKVVELSVYNGIPHLLIPVVTDPKKAAAALHWGVAEMTERYKKFADYNVRDLKGYNKKAESMEKEGDPQAPAKMPQILIIVDELADLMMVAPGEVEESICRLAQLARAAGIHLIIATQRPSVDVITGLIKANMPSRVAFAVSSGVDSRTILDMNGAEKLLGKGDMLFYPQGYAKPARIQGAFVSDKEVSDVVDFLKNESLPNEYSDAVEEKIESIGAGSAQSGAGAGAGPEQDSYFAEAGRFIIDKDKASIGMLQRVFKIGFNRAARIMDQLCEAGVVGEEEGTKPRKVLMSPEEFEQYIEEN